VLYGRDAELEQLRGCLLDASGGRGCLILLGGEAGIGKSALVRAFAREATEVDALVLTGACYALAVTPPYGPWIDLLQSYIPSGILPELPAVLTSAETLGILSGQDALFAEVVAFFSAVAHGRLLVLVLEDLHWADQASLDLLRHFARHLTSIRIVIIATYRDVDLAPADPLYRLLPHLVRETPALRLPLRRLRDEDVQRMIADRYGLTRSDERRLVQWLVGLADGNPFFIEELLRVLEYDAVLEPTELGWRMGDLTSTRVPPLVQQVIDGRLEQLDRETRELLQLAAVIGGEIPIDLWQRVAEVSEDVLAGAIEQALMAQVLEEIGNRPVLRFHHALIREALYRSLILLRRRAWHLRVAEALSKSVSPDPDAIAYHFQRAEDPRAADWLIQAGNRAQRTYAWRMAAERFEAALVILAGDDQRIGERGWLHYRIGRMLRFSNPAHGIVHLERAEHLATLADDPILAAYALADRGLLRCFIGKLDDGLSEMEAGVNALDRLRSVQTGRIGEIIDWVADSLPPAERAQQESYHQDGIVTGLNSRRGTLAGWLAGAGRFAEALAIAEPYLTEAGSLREDEIDATIRSSIGDAHNSLGLIHAALGRPEAAKSAFTAARDAFHAIDHYAIVAISALFEFELVVIPYLTDHLKERRPLLEEAAQARAKASGALPSGFGTEGKCAQSLLLEGHWKELREVALAARAHVNTDLREFMLSALAALAAYQGDTELAWAQVHERLVDGVETRPGDLWYFPSIALLRVAADLSLAAGDLVMARRWIEAYDCWLEWGGTVFGQAESHLLWARYHRELGDRRRAREHGNAAVERAREPRQPLALLMAYRLLGELDTAEGCIDEAGQHLNEALSLASACAAPFERALTLFALAELEAAAGRPSDALVLLEEVRKTATGLDACPLLERVEGLSNRLERETRSSTTPGGLSPRELEVLRLVTQGLTDAEIAEQLFISPRTVSGHLQSIYNKLGLSSRTAAAAFAFANDLFS
jgi:DNA-binding CsgD family transcriptional regulator